MSSTTTAPTVLSHFLLRRLKEAGCDHIFGVPGDFVLGLFNEILTSEVKYVGTCNELNAAYAADGYARMKGIGCVSTTYNVGELSALNGVAGSYAECVPVVKLSGVPATKYYKERTLLHHTLGDYNASLTCYQNVTVAQTLLSNPETAAAEIDRVLTACLKHKLPVYIGVPADMVLASIVAPTTKFKLPKAPKSDPCALEEVVEEAVRLLDAAKSPVLIPGVDVERLRLHSQFISLLEKSGLPYVTMMLSKGIISERHPQFIGLYCGDRSRESVRSRVENADCTVILGEKLTDFNTGGFSAALDRRKTVEASLDQVRVGFHTYHNVFLEEFIVKLTAKLTKRAVEETLQVVPAIHSCVHRPDRVSGVEPEKDLRMAKIFDRMASYLEPNCVVIAETGASLFSAAEVLLPENSKFIGQTFYGSIGYTVGATLGVCVAAPEKPVYLFVGDGSFQVTCQDLSTMIRYKCRPYVFLINNDGYTIERVIVDRPYNDTQAWKYHKLPEIFGGEPGFDCFKEGELEKALEKSKEQAAKNQLSFIEVHIDRWDCNEALRRAGVAMAVTNRLLNEEEREKLRDEKCEKGSAAPSETTSKTPSRSPSLSRFVSVVPGAHVH